MGARLSGSLGADDKEEDKTHEESSHSHGRSTSHPHPAQQAVCAVAGKLRWSATGAVPPNLQVEGTALGVVSSTDHGGQGGAGGRSSGGQRLFGKEGTKGEQGRTEARLFVKDTNKTVKLLFFFFLI